MRLPSSCSQEGVRQFVTVCGLSLCSHSSVKDTQTFVCGHLLCHAPLVTGTEHCSVDCVWLLGSSTDVAHCCMLALSLTTMLPIKLTFVLSPGRCRSLPSLPRPP